jgi:hypothetical protein
VCRHFVGKNNAAVCGGKDAIHEKGLWQLAGKVRTDFTPQFGMRDPITIEVFARMAAA